MSFEKVTGPLSPGAVAWMVSGGLRERLFPNSQHAFEACMADPTACENVGGYSLQVTPAGKVALSNFKALLGLKAAAVQHDAEFDTACAALAEHLYDEEDDDGYEVSMRLLALVTADPASPLQCALTKLDALWHKEAAERVIDWDVVKLTAYVEGMLAATYVLKNRGAVKAGLGGGFLGRTAKLMTVAGGSVLFYKSAAGTVHQLELDRWASESGRRYFVGTLRWLRKYRAPSQLAKRFRHRISGYMPGTSPEGWASLIP